MTDHPLLVIRIARVVCLGAYHLTVWTLIAPNGNQVEVPALPLSLS